ncbi:MAG: hypothetical protein AAB647_01160 [Patescibacteria group bacterium]
MNLPEQNNPSDEVREYVRAEEVLESESEVDKFKLSLTDQERKILEQIPQIGKKLIWERNERTFYAEFLPTIIGRQFDLPRNYGHAKYEIIGDQAAWKSERDAQKIYFHYASVPYSHSSSGNRNMGIVGITIDAFRGHHLRGVPPRAGAFTSEEDREKGVSPV